MNTPVLSSRRWCSASASYHPEMNIPLSGCNIKLLSTLSIMTVVCISLPSLLRSLINKGPQGNVCCLYSLWCTRLSGSTCDMTQSA